MKQQNVISSYLYKAVCHYPDTFVQNHPETQTTVSRLLTVTRGQASSNETNLSSGSSPWLEKTCGKCSPLSGKTSWGQWQTRNTILGMLLWRKQRRMSKEWWHNREMLTPPEVDFKLTIILVITLQVPQDPFHLFLCRFLMGVIHFLHLTDNIEVLQ